MATEKPDILLIRMQVGQVATLQIRPPNMPWLWQTDELAVLLYVHPSMRVHEAETVDGGGYAIKPREHANITEVWFRPGEKVLRIRVQALGPGQARVAFDSYRVNQNVAKLPLQKWDFVIEGEPWGADIGAVRWPRSFNELAK